MDPGSNKTFLQRRCLPAGATPLLANRLQTRTAAGTFLTQRNVSLDGMHLPEFGNSLRLERHWAHVFEANVPYDIIVGRDMLSVLGFDVSFSDRTMMCSNRIVPLKPATQARLFYQDDNDETFEKEEELWATTILPSKYDAHTISDIMKNQKHLTQEQRDKLELVLNDFQQLFDGQLKKYKGAKMKLRLKPGAPAVQCKPFPVPHIHSQLFAEELQRMVQQHVLERCGPSEHAYPTFVTPKKDGRVRVVSDFRKLNANLVREQYGLPRIKDVIQRRSGYRFFTKIDISMQYYTFEIDEQSQQLCVITTPFGNFRYLRVPMGIHNSPDFAQAEMEKVLSGLSMVEVYIDNIAIFGDDYDQHMKDVAEVLRRLQDAGLTVNPLKCEWAVQETDFLGYWLTPQGVKPWKKKIQPIIDMQPPSDVSSLRRFIGLVNYYRDMWPGRAHLLAPLTALTGAKHFCWDSQHQTAFDAMKAMITNDIMLTYPDHNKAFRIYTDASDLQLGSVIMQEGKPVALYSRKLSPAQRNYTTMEKELLSVVATLKEFRTMLLGAEIHVYTDHKNLTYATLNTQRVLRWRLYLEEFSPTFHYIKGQDNVVADFLSRAAIAEEKSGVMPVADPDEDNENVATVSFLDDSQLIDCLYNLPPECFLIFPNIPNPLDYDRLFQQQQTMPELVLLSQQQPQRYPLHRFGNNDLICYHPPNQHNYKIFIPTPMLEQMVNWYHQVLNHCGRDRLIQSIAFHFYHPQLRTTVEEVVKYCSTCQQQKLPGVGYGFLAPKETLFQPFYEVAVDSIGPWQVPVRGEVLRFKALTCIDTVTNLTEIIRTENNFARHTGLKFEQAWLHRYPRPVRVIFDQGPEFGGDFQRMLHNWGIRPRPTTTRNPQANAICERMHQTVAAVLRTFLHTDPPQDVQQAGAMVDYALSVASHALRSTVHSTLGLSPGAITFNRDMLIDVPYVADLIHLRQRRQALIDHNLRRENNRRRAYDYTVGDYVFEVLIKRNEIGKTLVSRSSGPYLITQVHTNGTLTIQRRPGLTDRINIRRLRPAFRR